MTNSKNFKGNIVKGVLLDITGVLLDSTSQGDGGSYPIPGSVDAIKKLNDAGILVRFVTNESQRSRDSLVKKLHNHGFTMPAEHVFSPAMALLSLAKAKSLRPYFLVHESLYPDIQSISTNDPNCVVLGDAAHSFSYENLNKAFKILIESDGDLYSMGKGKYYKEDGELILDVGPFAAALEFATDRQAVVVGKPSREFFETALADMGVAPEEAVMVGDDIISDVGGAQDCGVRGVLVRTGKFRPCDEIHPEVKPDAIVNNLLDFVENLLC